MSLSYLMSVPFLGGYIVWILVMLPKFHMYMLLLSSVRVYRIGEFLCIYTYMFRGKQKLAHVTVTIHLTHFPLRDPFSTGLMIQMNEVDWVNWEGVGY
jgi:hypothetical protein